MAVLVHETDDGRYEAAKPFGAEIKVLCRWEMECYLADAAALEQCRAELSLHPRRPDREVAQELLEHCQALVPHAAINATCHEIKVQGLGDGYTNRFLTRDAVDADIRATKLPTLPGPGAARYDHHVPLVDAFDVADSPPSERVSALLRRVNGKAVLQRFGYTHRIQVDLKGLLANRIKEHSRVPAEITRFIEGVLK